MSPLLTKGGVILAKILKNGILSVIMTMVILTLSPLTAFSQEYEPRLTAPQGVPFIFASYGFGNVTEYAAKIGEMKDLLSLFSGQ